MAPTTCRLQYCEKSSDRVCGIRALPSPTRRLLPVSENVAPATVYASTSSNIAACAAPDPARDIIARSDALAAQKLKREAWQATRAPVMEHVKKPHLQAPMQVPRERLSPNMMHRPSETSSVKPIDRLMLHGKLPVVCSTCTDQPCWDLFLDIVGLLV